MLRPLSAEQFVALLEADPHPGITPRWEVPPAHRLVIVRQAAPDALEVCVPATRDEADQVTLRLGRLLWFVVPESALPTLGLV